MKTLTLVLVALFSLSVAALADHHEGHKTESGTETMKTETTGDMKSDAAKTKKNKKKTAKKTKTTTTEETKTEEGHTEGDGHQH